MKLRFWAVLIIGLGMLSACGDNNTNNYLDERKYSVEDEYTYSVLLYDYHNSLILSLLGAKNNNFNQAEQIEEIRKRNGYKVNEAELRAAILSGTMNMLMVKEKTIAELHKQQVSLLNEHLEADAVQNTMKYYMEELYRAKAKLMAGNMFMNDALIDYYILNPRINYDSFDKELPLPLVNTASSIAITRFDNLQWHKKIADCLQEKSLGKQELPNPENVIFCAKDYTQAVSEEAAKVSRQLLPFRKHFEAVRPLADKSKND